MPYLNLSQTNCLQAGEELALHVQQVGHTNDLSDSDDNFPANFNLITLKDGFQLFAITSESYRVFNKY